MSLAGRSVVVLASPGYQELDLWFSVLRAREVGANVAIVGPDGVVSDSILGYPAMADTAATDVDLAALDALVVPGGRAGDAPELDAGQIELVRAAASSTAVVVTIGNGADAVAAAGGGAPDLALAGTDELAGLFPALDARLATR